MKKFRLKSLISALKLMGARRFAFTGSCLAFCLINVAACPLLIYGLRRAVNGVSDMNMDFVISGVLMFGGGHLIWDICAPIWSYVTNHAVAVSIREIMANLAARAIAMPQRALDEMSAGELISAFDNGANALRSIYNNDFYKSLESFFASVAPIIIMTFIDWRFTIIMMAVGGAGVLAGGFFSRRLGARGEELQNRLAKTGANAYELIRCARGIRALGIARFRGEEFRRRTRAEMDVRAAMAADSAALSAAMALVSAGSYIALIGAGAYMVAKGMTDWGAVLAISSMKFAAECIFTEFPQNIAKLNANLAGSEMLIKLINAAAEEIAPGEAPIGEIAVENLSFGYEDENIIESLSLRFPASGLAAIVGESGSGKSTLMKLLLGLYAPRAGRIVDSRGNALKRGSFAYVPQNAMLMAGSALENITLFAENPDAARAEQAARSAGIYDKIMELPGGFGAKLSDNAGDFSGGERTRLGIARALYHGGALMLDEPTASLDSDNARIVLDTLKSLSRERLIVAVTHDGALTALADRVIRLD